MRSLSPPPSTFNPPLIYFLFSFKMSFQPSRNFGNRYGNELVHPNAKKHRGTERLHENVCASVAAIAGSGG